MKTEIWEKVKAALYAAKYANKMAYHDQGDLDNVLPTPKYEGEYAEFTVCGRTYQMCPTSELNHALKHDEEFARAIVRDFGGKENIPFIWDEGKKVFIVNQD